MSFKRFILFIITFALVITPFATPLSGFAQAPQAAAQVQTGAPSLEARLATIEQKIEAGRKKYGIPGVALVIVKDDKIIYLKGLGTKDSEHNLPVTPDTLFAIGSSTKAFTAMTIMMAVDEGKLSLDDPPKKYLPYFKLYDPDADAKITIRDLLSHTSGLGRTDLAFAIGNLNREEVIRVAGLARPTAKFREVFQYQNVMFTAAGEIASRVEGVSWENLIRTRIFQPLGMKSSDLTVEEMQKASDFSYGYNYNTDTKSSYRLPMRDIPAAAPAGAINSTARDMAAWLRLMLGGGMYEGKRLVSEKSFNELVSKQMTVAGSVSYGLGWFLRMWRGHKVVEHGGNIDGFNAEVAFMPDQNLGFALLTNISGSPLGGEAMSAIWSGLVDTPKPSLPATAIIDGDALLEVGTYNFAEAKMTVDVSLVDKKLVMTVPGQPKYTLENVGGRRYKLTYPGLEGFYATFRPAKDNPKETEIYLEQPQGNYVLPRIGAADKPKTDAVAANYDGPMKELLGTYAMEGADVTVEVAIKDGKVTLLAPGAQAYPLVEKVKDEYALSPLPETYKMNVKRDASGKVIAIVTTQPEGVFTFNRLAAEAPSITTDELMARVIAASGGENLRKHKSMVTKVALDFLNQGLQGEAVVYNKAPNLSASDATFLALGKKIGTSFEYFDGTTARQETSFSSPLTYTGKQLAAARVNADFYGLLNWKTLFKSVEIKRKAKVGDEETYVVALTPNEGNPITIYVSTKTFMVLKRDTVYSASDSTGVEFPVSETYSDFRPVDGVIIPFKSVTKSPIEGDIVSTVTSVEFDVAIPDTTFRSKGKKYQ